MWELVTEVALFGAAQIGLLLFGLGRMWSTQNEHGRRLDRYGMRLSKVEEGQTSVIARVAKLEGEVGL